MNRTTNSIHPEGRQIPVVAIECLKGSSRADEWDGELLQTGDIVEEIVIGTVQCLRSPFKNGKQGLQQFLKSSYKKKETSIIVRIRRGNGESRELQGCIVPFEVSGKKQFVLRAINDANYYVTFENRTESECLEIQASRSSRVVSALSMAQLQDGYSPYRWDIALKQNLSIPNSSSFLSILFLPKVSDRTSSQYRDLEDTQARANAWLNASQQSGVPIVFMNIQTEAHLSKISGDTASSTVSAGSLSDLSNLANASLYGFEDYHGIDIGVVRCIRLWYAPAFAEIPVDIKLTEEDSKLGFSISRTREGFLYISSVSDENDNGSPSASSRSGLVQLYQEANRVSKLLVISRISNEKVLPWMVNTTGAIRSFDTISVSQKLSLHRHALRPILLYVFIWDQGLLPHREPISRPRTIPPQLELPQELHRPAMSFVNSVAGEEEQEDDDDDGGGRGGDVGDTSFRFH